MIRWLIDLEEQFGVCWTVLAMITLDCVMILWILISCRYLGLSLCFHLFVSFFCTIFCFCFLFSVLVGVFWFCVLFLFFFSILDDYVWFGLDWFSFLLGFGLYFSAFSYFCLLTLCLSLILVWFWFWWFYVCFWFCLWFLLVS